MTAAWIAFILYAAVAITLGWRAHRRQVIATAGAVAAASVFALNTESLWDIFYLSSGVLMTAVAFPVAAVFLPRTNPRGVRFSSIAGLGGIILAYFLEVHGPLAEWEPAWLADTGLGFILWGILAAGAGYIIGASTYRD